MRRFLHHEAGQRDGVFHGGHAGDGPAPPPAPIHDARLHFHRSIRRQRRSAARIEKGVTLQFSHLKPDPSSINRTFHMHGEINETIDR